MVVIRGFNDDELPALADWGRRHDRELRFIEFMPLEAKLRTRVSPGHPILA